jgi:hypothetical protein
MAEEEEVAGRRIGTVLVVTPWSLAGPISPPLPHSLSLSLFLSLKNESGSGIEFHCRVGLSHLRVFTHTPQRDAETETETNLHTETRVTENTGHRHKGIVFPMPLNPFLPLRSSISHSSPYSPFSSSPFSHTDLNLSFVTAGALFSHLVLHVLSPPCSPLSHSVSLSPLPLPPPLPHRAARHDVFSAELKIRVETLSMAMLVAAATKEVFDRVDQEGAGEDGEKRVK